MEEKTDFFDYLAEHDWLIYAFTLILCMAVVVLVPSFRSRIPELMEKKSFLCYVNLCLGFIEVRAAKHMGYMKGLFRIGGKLTMFMSMIGLFYY